MPMIQIEQDSPVTIEGARRCFGRMNDSIRKSAGDLTKRHGFAMHSLGYLGALMATGLISQAVYDQLNAELDAALGVAAQG